jgi:hypothetical protein
MHTKYWHADGVIWLCHQKCFNIVAAMLLCLGAIDPGCAITLKLRLSQAIGSQDVWVTKLHGWGEAASPAGEGASSPD